MTQAWGTRLATFAVFPVLGRLLTEREFGLMALAVGIVELGRVLVDQLFARAIIQRDELDDGHLDTAFWTAVASGLALMALAMVLSPVAADAFDAPQLTPVLRVMSVSFLLMSFTTTQLAILQRSLQFRGLALRQLVSVVAGGAVGIATAVGGAGVWALVAQNLTQATVAVIVLWAVSPWRPGRRFDAGAFREMASFGSATMAIEVVGYFARRGDDLLVGAFLGTSAVGFFNVAYRILNILTEVFASTINAVAFPVFSRLQHDAGRMRRALHAVTRLSSAAAFPAFLGLAVLAPQFLPTVFGDGWGPSIPVLQILCLVGLMRSVTHFNRAVLLALGKPSWELAWVVFTVATKVGAFAIGYRWGLEGVAWAVVVHGYLLAPLNVWLVNRASPIAPAAYFAQFLRPLVASLAMVAVVVPLRLSAADALPGIGVLALGVGVGAAVYAGVLALVAPALVRELRSRFRDILPGRRKATQGA